jgi:NYN domain-containing protein
MRAKVKGSKATQLSDRWQFPERTLHVVDIENLAGAGIPTLIQVSMVQDWYLTKLGFGAADQAVLASSHLGLINTALGWPHARYRVRSGRDGADLELIDVLEHEDVARRFRHVVIGSGDGMFGRVAESLRDRGVRVTVVSRPGSLAATLAQAAQHVVYLDF